MSEPPFATQPISYATPIAPRPGIITALGVCSIVFGSMGILASLCGVLQSSMYFAMSRISLPVPATMPVVPLPTSVPTSAPSTLSAAPSVAGISYTPYSTTGSTATTFSPFRVSPTAVTFSVIAEVLSFAVAIMLLIAGIAVMRNTRRAARMHWIYVGVKVPVVVMSSCATFWMTTSMMRNFATMVGPGTTPAPTFSYYWTGLVQAGLYGGVSLMYPLAVIIVLLTPPAKTYFGRGALR